MEKHGRNDPCPCGSGKKYKKCCLSKESAPIASLAWLKMRRTEGELIPILLKHADKYYGPEALVEAWDEFSLWDDVPLDPSSQPELDTAFLPWFVFNWIPDNAEIEETEHIPEMPVAQHYLEAKGSRLDEFQQCFIKEICSQAYSFFMVTDVEPGESLTLRDLILGREVTVHERQASSTLPKASIIFTRIITMDDASIMVGCAPTVIPPIYHSDFIDVRENLAEKFPNDDQSFLFEYDIELRTMYYDIREELSHPSLPQLHNTDGDYLQLTKLSYTLTCTPRQALDALITLSMIEDADELAQDGNQDERGDLVSIEFPWLKKGGQQHASWDNTVMGHIVINHDQLTIEVNSQERADMIKQELEFLLGNQAIFRNAVIESSEKMLEEIANHSPDTSLSDESHKELQETPEVQAQLQEMSEHHWQTWLDTPLPALKSQTPREAAKTETGRERLQVLFWQFETQNTSLQSLTPDVDTLRQALGMK
ncbi:MAG: hypothetical protein NPIRA01_07660 [Nitrospirales bacterium]|nr:MAG: hypothetical protein NPIRA01_07660 [Nitrospirales bacterium]